MREKRTPLKSISFNALSRIEVPSLSLMKTNPFLFPKPSATISIEPVEVTKSTTKLETTVNIPPVVVGSSPPSTPPLTPGAQAQSGSLSDAKASDDDKGDQPLTEVQIHMLKAIRNHGGAAPLSHIQEYVAKIWSKLRKRDGSRYTYDYRRVISASLANTSNANPLFEKHGTRVGWWTIGQRGKGIELDENDNVIVGDGTVVVPDKVAPPEVESEEEEEEDDEDDADGDEDAEDEDEEDEEDEEAAEEEEGSPYKGKRSVAKRGRPKSAAPAKIKSEDVVSPDHASSDVSSNLSISNDSVHGEGKERRRKPVRRSYVPPPPVPEVMTSRESRKLMEISRRIEQKDRLEREKAEAMLSPKRRRVSGADTPIKSEKEDKRKGNKLKDRNKEDSKSDREDDRPTERKRGRPPKAEKKRKREDEEVELTRKDKEPLNRERRGKRRSGQRDDLSDSQQSDDKDNDIDQTLTQLQVIVGLAISENNGSASMETIVNYVTKFVKTFRWSVNGKRGFQRRTSEEPYVDEDTLLAAIESSLNDKGNFVTTKKDNSKEGYWVLNKKFLSPASLKSLAPSFEPPDQSSATNSPKLGDSLNSRMN